jgi:cell pole-organizing protein PopZ
MTDQTAQEPTMEEILASIRRIISEDDAPAEAGAADDESAEAPEPVAVTDEAPAAAEEDVLELTDEAPAAESIGDLDVSAPEPEPEPFPAAPASESVFAAEPVEVHEPEHPSVPTSSGYDTLVGDSAAASAASAFAGFASTLRKPQPMDGPATVGPTIDELVRALLRPMLKEWLDANLPAIVEAQVRKEVERIARNAG